MKLVKFYNTTELDIDKLCEKHKISRKVMEIIVSRGFKTGEEVEDFLHPKTKYSPFALKNMDALVLRLKTAISKKERIVVFGDYDVDGVSATAIMLKTIQRLGGRAHFYLPNRFLDGYGLTNEIIDKLKKKHNPNLIITVDCGISCHDEVEYAKTLGIEIIVTDHHEEPAVTPETIVVSAKCKNQEYPFDGLCGAGVAYKISEALLGKGAEELLPIAAIATIADIVPLLSENRRIVVEGLKLFERYLPIGLKMLFKANKLSIINTNSTDISFKISPKLNASGRMGDATDSLLLYLETDPIKLQKLIDKIHAHNVRRQELCSKVHSDAKRALQKVNMSDIRIICLSSKSWDHGILGIVCSRLLEEYNRPVFLFSHSDGVLKGSGRSIDDINIHGLLASMEDILETYGGHTMAAGVSIKPENYDEFVKRVNSFAFESINDKVFMPISYYDTELLKGDITKELVEDLTRLEPYGCCNPRPRFFIEGKDVKIEPMRNFPQHADMKVGDSLKLTYFNFLSKRTKLSYFENQEFIFELQQKDKGIVQEFESGRHIKKSAGEIAKLGALAQLQYLDSKKNAKFKIYTPDKLLPYITQMGASVFGTCFVATSLKDYENFVSSYDQKDIYNNVFMSFDCDGFNTLALSPTDVSFAKNFKRIIFISPVMDLSYIAKINEISSAEVYVPADLKFNFERIPELNISRENFGRIFKSLRIKAGKQFRDFLDFTDGMPKSFSILDIYLACLVFEELGIIKIDRLGGFKFYVDNEKKSNLTESKIYNFVNLLMGTKERKNGS